jgi:hypothetical protein
MGTIVTPVAIRRYALAAVACLVVSSQYASAQNPALTIVSSQRFADGAGNAVVIGEVRNGTNATLYIPRAIVTLTAAQTTNHTVEVWTSSARKLSGTIFTFGLAPNQTGFFRLSTAIPNATISSHSVTAEAQALFTAGPMETSLSVVVQRNGDQYSLVLRNQGDAAIAHNIQSAVGGYVNGVLTDVDFSGTPGSGGNAPCATAMLPPGSSTVTISGSFDRPITDMLGQGIALKWDEIFVSPSAFTAPGAGGVGDIRVASQCAWTAQSHVSWITITSGASGTGDGFVRISAPANPTTVARTGTLTVAGLTVRVEQAAGSGNSFSDPTLTSQVTPVRALHITELRSRIQALRSRFGLGAYSFGDDPLSAGTPIRAVHVTQLRLALADVYVAAKRAAPMYSESSVTAGMTIKATHITELRAGVLAIE